MYEFNELIKLLQNPKISSREVKESTFPSLNPDAYLFLLISRKDTYQDVISEISFLLVNLGMVNERKHNMQCLYINKITTH